MAKVLCVDISGVSESFYEKLYCAADPERRYRADRYPKKYDALRCIAAGVLLHYAVNKELGLSEYAIETAENGKPFLKDIEGFHYNLSHSGKWVVLAWAETAVGVDVERMRPDANWKLLAKRFFTPEEQSWILESEQALQRFYRVWTGKESYLKYLGTGLRKGLNSFRILEPEIAQKLIHRELEGGYNLTVCTDDTTCTFELLEPAQLI